MAPDEDFNSLLTQYAIERFLYRLSKSSQQSQFILKGAMLFRAWSGVLHRPTKDIDLLGYGQASTEAVSDEIRQIINTSVEDDGLWFDPESIISSEIREDLEYGGIRIKLMARLGNAKIPLQIDVGFGDAVTPAPKILKFPTLLDMEEPVLRMYPPETVVAEKIEAAVIRGMNNSRMKDYYDLLVIFRTYDLKDETLTRAIAATFDRRQTELPSDIPLGLSDEFGKNTSVQRLWEQFLERLQIEDAPAKFSEVLGTIRDRIIPLLKRAVKSKE